MTSLNEEVANVLAHAVCIYDQTQVEAAIDELANRLIIKLQGEDPIILCVMNGGLIFTSQILLRLQFPLQVEYIHATRYRGSTQGSSIEWLRKPAMSLEDRNVLILDDIFDEGYTLAAIQKECRKQKPRTLLSAVLVEKRHNRKCPDVQVDYMALAVDDRYVFGYGMDYKNYLRNMAGIYAVSQVGQ